MVRQIAPKTQLGLIKSNVNQGEETIAPEIVTQRVMGSLWQIILNNLNGL